MAKIQLDLSEEFAAFREEMDEKFRQLSEQIRGIVGSGAQDWISINEAKQILGYESKKKWKNLRDSGQVDFALFGRAYKYHRPSLIRLIENNSTLKSKPKQNGKAKQI